MKKKGKFKPNIAQPIVISKEVKETKEEKGSNNDTIAFNPCSVNQNYIQVQPLSPSKIIKIQKKLKELFPTKVKDASSLISTLWQNSRAHFNFFERRMKSLEFMEIKGLKIDIFQIDYPLSEFKSLRLKKSNS